MNFFISSLGILEKIFDRFRAHFKMLYSISSSMLSPRHFSNPSRPIDSSLAPLEPAEAVPLRTYSFLKEFSPKDYPLERVMGSLPRI